MRYEYSDGMVIDYSGSIHITKGSEIDIFLEEDYIPKNVKHDLEEASRRNNQEEMRKIAVLLSDTVGSRACMADVDSKKCEGW